MYVIYIKANKKVTLEMKQTNYMDFVAATVATVPYGVPLYTGAIAEDLAQTFHLDLDKARKLANVYLKRLADGGTIARLKKGVYGRAKTTVFGVAVPARDEMIADTLLREGNETIGYETGAALLNRIGLSTLLPKERQIATNRYRAIIPVEAGIAIKKPLAHVTTYNAPYLQMLEVLKGMHRYSIDAEYPETLVRTEIAKQGLDQAELIRYANAYLKAEELQNAIGIILGRLDEREAA